MAIALVLFGPKRLPEVGRQVGVFVRDLRKTVGQISDAVEGVHSDVRGVMVDPAPRSSSYVARSVTTESAAPVMRPYSGLVATASVPTTDAREHGAAESADLPESAKDAPSGGVAG